jgi:hypothetical protein
MIGRLFKLIIGILALATLPLLAGIALIWWVLTGRQFLWAFTKWLFE